MNKKLRIAFICNGFPIISETFIRNQIDYFIKKGHKVDIIATGHLVSNQILRNYNTVYGMKSNIQKVSLFPLIFLYSLFRNPSKAIKSLNFFRYGKEAIFLKIFYPLLFVRDKTYDIIMCHFGDSGIVGSFIKKELMKESKLICMFHGADIRRGIKRGGEIYNSLFEYADGILSISEYNREYLKRWYRGNLIYHPVGISMSKKRKIVRNDKTIKVLTVGRLVKEKGYIYALRAIKRLILNNSDKKIEYHIIGGGNYKKFIESYIKKNNLTTNVFLHGEKEYEEVINYYISSDIFLLTSIVEALPVVIMEAQYFELPVVVTNVGSVQEEIIDKKSGFIVPTRDSNEILKKLQWLVDHQNKWSEMGAAGQLNIKNKYDINELNKNLEKLFYELLNTKR